MNMTYEVFLSIMDIKITNVSIIYFICTAKPVLKAGFKDTWYINKNLNQIWYGIKK